MSAQAEEVPFLRGMRPEEPATQEIRVTVDPREIYRGDGMMWELLRKIRRALGMVPEEDRGPKDYATSDFERGMKAGAKLGGYHEAPKNGGSTSWQKWMLALCGTLATAGVIGGVAMYGKVAAVEANQISQQKQLDNLTQMLLNLTRRNP